ncbi:uncharacterized protein LOC114337369 [Diabrotica virgifera virgifera]|uniref:Uncharacterized protein LOC114337369 n=1 Tax=Diabrotica virgifera virgifera TaxID=50390 RepID=A0A6P7GF12_DIAVI|nr:uncharacterized protein LOC114337369 [Diabrotica virgifera virgifera]
MSFSSVSKSSSGGSEHSKKSKQSKSSKNGITAKPSQTLLPAFSTSSARLRHEQTLRNKSELESDIPPDKEDKEELIESIILEPKEEKLSTFGELYAHLPKLGLADYQKRNMGKEDLFPKVLTLDSANELVEVKKEAPSILVTGFGMRNLQSLQNALDEESKRLLEIYRRQQKHKAEITCTRTPDVSLASASSSTSTSTTKSTSTSETVTEAETIGERLKLEYLMGLHQDEEEEYLEMEPEPKEDKELSFIYSSSIAMKKAQHYLRVHRIFDFIRFIIAHLLGSAPENPVSFILELLNKCLLYRSGAGQPPLLYEMKHISQMFLLMDRMNSGFIEMNQYVQGMTTFGLCDYNKKPSMTVEGISKKTFVEEVYEAEINFFNDIIRRKYVKGKGHKDTERAINYDNIPSRESRTAYFIPSDLFKSIKREKLSQIKEDTEG